MDAEPSTSNTATFATDVSNSAVLPPATTSVSAVTEPDMALTVESVTTPLAVTVKSVGYSPLWRSPRATSVPLLTMTVGAFTYTS